MDKAQLISHFQSQIEAFDRFQAFVDKAKDMGAKFRPEVVQKVIADNAAKRDAVVETLVPLVDAIQAQLADITSRRGQVASSAETARVTVEELQLRKEIGELDDAAFDEAAAGPLGEIEAVDTRLAQIDADAADLSGALEAWIARRPAGITAPVMPAPSAAAAPADDLLGDLEEDDAFGVAASGRGEGVHAELRTGIADDVSAVFEEDEPSVPSSDVAGISFGDDDLHDLGATSQATVTAGPSTPARGAAGAAVMVLGEGTPDEQVFGFDGEVISIGRGRDNTIQVKNDSKVSRYHCKVFTRDGMYFVEDNKSANGTLVDGELITEKRLVGGEEVIVGESFFRFRVRG